uniref:Dihydroxyacetone reductase n=1 Tax=Zygoascus ofunaensis TaxID=45509 RepID=Q6BC30_9ASCO|nr:dihydroxyacetone reductase [Zygoascus ofunaensis]
MMKALCYLGSKTIKWQTVAKPTLKSPTDVIGKLSALTLCGSDLHIIAGHVKESTDIAESQPGRGLILGHEGIIKVEEVGDAVKNFKRGDVCIVSCITSCGECYYCKRDLQSHCNRTEGTSGWILGHEIDGTQAEYVRIPYADQSLYKAPENVPIESLLMLSDILPTAYEVGVVSGNVKKGDTVAIVGLGPVGLSALLSAKALDPAKIIAIDMDDSRLEVARRLGAHETINPGKQDAAKLVHELTASEGKSSGVDVAIECVGVPATFEMCEDLLCPGGHLSNVGVHGSSVELKLQELWIKNISISTGLVSAYSTETLLQKVIDKKLDPTPLATHHFKLSEIEKAYDVFSHAADNQAIKMVITCDE